MIKFKQRVLNKKFWLQSGHKYPALLWPLEGYYLFELWSSISYALRRLECKLSLCFVDKQNKQTNKPDPGPRQIPGVTAKELFSSATVLKRKTFKEDIHKRRAEAEMNNYAGKVHLQYTYNPPSQDWNGSLSVNGINHFAFLPLLLSCFVPLVLLPLLLLFIVLLLLFLWLSSCSSSFCCCCCSSSFCYSCSLSCPSCPSSSSIILLF